MRFGRALGVLLWAVAAASALGSAPLLGWVEGHRVLAGDRVVAAVARWHGAMRAIGLDAPYAGIRRAFQHAGGDR